MAPDSSRVDDMKRVPEVGNNEYGSEFWGMQFSQDFYRSLFTRLAPFYRIINVLSLGSTAHQRRVAVRHAGIKPGSFVADLMCGTGNNTELVLQAGAGRYIGIDAALEMMAQGAYQDAGTGLVSYIQADLTKPLPYPMNVQHVLCTYGIKCLDINDYDSFTQIIDQILEPGGTVSILEFRLPKNHVFRFLANIYVGVFSGLVCLVLTGKWPPTRDLYRSMTPDIYPALLAKLLRERGFQITIEERPLGSAVLVYGKKL